MSDEQNSVLLLLFGDLKFRLSTPADTPLDRLKQLACVKCGADASQPVRLEYFDTDFDEWAVVDDDYKLPPKGKLRVSQKLSSVEASCVSSVSKDVTNTSSEGSGAGNKEVTDAGGSQPKPAESSQKPGEVVEDGEKKLEYSICMSAPEVTLSGKSSDQGAGAAAAVAKEKIWKNRESLKVYFMNGDVIEDWKCRGEPMNVNTVIAWARVWNFVEYPEIPLFEVTEREKNADIRVLFSDTGGNWSMVGTEANNVPKGKPTMQLNLRGHHAELQESLVIHEFGHALGLEHEHQRSDFWRVLEPYIDKKKMMEDPRVNPQQSEDGKAAFGKNWFKKDTSDASVNVRSEYDPDSIMHYWFDLNWIKDERLRVPDNIDRTLADKPEEAKYLRGLVKRSEMKYQLSKRPTVRDYRVLVEAYGGGYKEALTDQLQHILDVPLKQPKPKDSGQTVLRVNSHLRYIRNAVWDARSNWRRLGWELALTEGTLDAIDMDRRNTGDKLGAVLEKWMYTGKATIYELLKALDSPIVGRGDLVKEIEKHKDGEKSKNYGF